MRHEYVRISPKLGNRRSGEGGSAPGADEALTEIESLLLRAYHGKEDADGGDEDLGDP